jgi:hypothetical protein
LQRRQGSQPIRSLGGIVVQADPMGAGVEGAKAAVYWPVEL